MTGAGSSAWNLPLLDAYFDSGLVPSAGDPDAVVQLGFAIFLPGATDWQKPLNVGRLTCLPGDAPAGLWGLNHPRLGPEERAKFADSKAAKGLQFYDLVAARALGVNLSGSGFSGEVNVFGDGEAVIRFLTGDLRALTLRAGDIEFARDLRAEVIGGFGPTIKVNWKFTKRENNLADPAMKALQVINVYRDGSASVTLPGGPTYRLRGGNRDKSKSVVSRLRRLIGR